MIDKSKMTEKNIREFVNFLKEYFKDIDIDFLEGFLIIFEHMLDKIKNDGWNVETPSQEYPIEQTLEMIEEFYNSLSPALGNATHNHLQKMRYRMSPDISSKEDIEFDKTRKYSEKKILSFENSSLNAFTLEGNYRDVVVGSHEVAHRFTSNQSATPTQIASLMFDEADTMYAEMLCTDFINAKYKQNFIGIYNFRTIALKSSLESHDFDKSISNIEALKCLVDYLKFVQNNEINNNISDFKAKTEVLDKKLNSGKGTIFEKKEFVLSQIYDAFEYHFAFTYANFLYQEAQKAPEKKADIFKKLLKINSYKTGFEDEQLSVIEDTGLPIVKDGKISLESQGIEAFISAFDKTYETFKARAKVKKTMEMKPNHTDSIQGKDNNTLSVKSAVVNALKDGVTMDDVKNAERIEVQEQQYTNDKSSKEGDIGYA